MHLYVNAADKVEKHAHQPALQPGRMWWWAVRVFGTDLVRISGRLRLIRRNSYRDRQGYASYTSYINSLKLDERTGCKIFLQCYQSSLRSDAVQNNLPTSETHTSNIK